MSTQTQSPELRQPWRSEELSFQEEGAQVVTRPPASSCPSWAQKPRVYRLPGKATCEKREKTSSHAALSLFLKYGPCCPPPMIEGQRTDLFSSARLCFNSYFYKSSKNILCFLSHLPCLKNYLRPLFIAPFEIPTLVSLFLIRPSENTVRVSKHSIEQAILKNTLEA